MVLLTTTVVAAAFVVSAADDTRLKRGEVVVHVSEDESGEADGHIKAAIDIAAPPSSVFATMLDCARMKKILNHLKSCKVLEVAPDGKSDVREHVSKWLAVIPEIKSVFRSVYVKDREIAFEKAGGDYKFLKGAWHFEPMNSGRATRLTYDVRVGLGVPMPGFMIRSALEDDFPKTLQALRTEVLTGGN